MKVSLQKISKKYREHEALSDVSIEINEGELIALLGPSGSGKTTLLKIIAGLEVPSQGQVLINNINVTNLLPNQRAIGFVFQHYALFKHMSIYENIAFGLKVKPKNTRPNDKEIKQKVNNLLKLVQIKNLSNRLPHELSGGQRQRAALARALAIEPKILLLDEPFSALDDNLKIELRRWLHKLKKETNITIIIVTHDQEEALDIADRVVVLNNGAIEQIDTPENLYHSPNNPFIYNFLGHYNTFQASKDASGKISILSKKNNVVIDKKKWFNKHKIVLSITNLLRSNNDQQDTEDNKEYFQIFVRPHDMEISNKPISNEYIPAIITYLNLAGPIVKLELESPDYELIQAEISHDIFTSLNIKKGDMIYTRARQFTMFEI
jgi:sulfate/thiosulfate transport system ATP-binding protein